MGPHLYIDKLPQNYNRINELDTQRKLKLSRTFTVVFESPFCFQPTVSPMDITRRVKQSLHLSALSSTQGLLSYSKYFARCSGMVMIGIKILAPAASPFHGQVYPKLVMLLWPQYLRLSRINVLTQSS